jgi:hypothetical protein
MFLSHRHDILSHDINKIFLAYMQEQMHGYLWNRQDIMQSKRRHHLPNSFETKHALMTKHFRAIQPDASTWEYKAKYRRYQSILYTIR